MRIKERAAADLQHTSTARYERCKSCFDFAFATHIQKNEFLPSSLGSNLRLLSNRRRRP